jgi:hypothetical protein
MKIFTLLLALILSLQAFAQSAPPSVKGQADASYQLPKPNLQFPNSQVTNLGGLTSLIESGNKNILANPSGEHSTVPTSSANASSWINATGSAAAETSTVIDGKKSVKVTMSSQALNLYQDSTLYAAQFADGVQGLAYKRVKTTITSTPIYVCPRQAGAYPSQLTSGCVKVVANGKWGLYKVPFLLGATSNGIGITSNSVAITGDVYIDDAFVGAVDLKQEVPVTSYLGTVKHPGIVNCQWTMTSTSSFTNYSADSDCTTPVVSGSLKAPATKIPGFIIPQGSSLGHYMIVMRGGFLGSAAGNQCAWRLSDGTNATTPLNAADSDTGVSSTSGGTFDYTLTANGSDTTVQVQALSDSDACIILNQTTKAETTFDVYYVPTQGMTAYSTNDYPFSTDRNTLTWQPSTVYTLSSLNTSPIGTMISWSYGSGWTPTQCGAGSSPTQTMADVLVNGLLIYSKTYSGSSTCGAPARVAINVGTGYSGVNASIFKSSGKATIGDIDFDTLDGNTALGAYREFDAKNGILIIDAGFNWFSTTTVHTFNFSDKTQQTSGYVSLNAVKDTSAIIGQFNGLESCADSYQCTSEFNAFVTDGSSTTTVSNENLDFITGDCTNPSAGVYACTFKTGVFTVAPVCTVNGTGQRIVGVATTTSSVSLNMSIDSGVATDSSFHISCEKTGADAVFKTARAVSSDQNVATPGVTKSTLCSAKISSAGVISDQKGGCFASCTNATTPVCTFTSNYWVSGQIPNCWMSGQVAGYKGEDTTTTTTFSGITYNGSTVAISGAREYFCHGERQ